MIVVENLCFNYNNLQVLKNISFSITKGDILCVLGLNGTGKTTLLKTILQLIKPTSGTIHYDSALLLNGAIESKNVAYISQINTTPFDFTVFELILWGRSPYFSTWGWHSKEDDAIAMEIIRIFELEHLLNKSIQHLSGGEQRRVFIAQAICRKPILLLADEPLANLDIKHQRQLVKFFTSFASGGKTIVGVFHDINFALSLGTKFLLLKNSKAVFLKKDEITSEILSEYYDCSLKIDYIDGCCHIVIPQS